MKKTILVLSLTAIFSSSVMAEATPSTPDRPTPDFGDTPHWGIGPDTPVERPELADPDFGQDIPEQPPVDNSPDRPQPPTPTQPPIDNTPDRPAPGEPTQPPIDNTPEWGIPAISDGDRINTLENEFKTMAEENNRRFNEQDDKIDGVRAGLHAVANARPFVTEGEFAIGAGIGFSGSKEALALGGAYGINEKLSVSGTFHYESSGSYSSSDVAGGVGIQYNFK
ncbi:YadA C-terminal domain-containing protein [Aliivibrio wodanis]|uniref:YadA C-terminal domain-containing protein n=1 Tax=Aliivibrio wodanis TaxID=80852 RepID=UPI00406BE380